MDRPLTATNARLRFFPIPERHWIPLYEDESLEPFLARVEYAKSGRATCRMCCEKIDKATAKVGLPMKWQGGKSAMGAPFGWGTSWAHPQCVRVKPPEEGGVKALEKKIYGLANLAPKDRKAVVDEISRTDTPETLKELRPEDVDAMIPVRPPSRAFSLLCFDSNRKKNPRNRCGFLLQQN